MNISDNCFNTKGDDIMINSNSINELANKLLEILSTSVDTVYLNKVKGEVKKSEVISFKDYKRIQANPFIISDYATLTTDGAAKLFGLINLLEKIDFKKIKVKDYFTEIEILNYKNYVPVTKTEDDYHVFYNVIKKAEDQYQLTLTIKELVELREKNLVRVDENFQRQSKIIINPETQQVQRHVVVNPKRVAEIATLIRERKYYFDELKLSLIRDEDSKLIYNEEEKTLYWYGDCVVPDGNHRWLACIKAYGDATLADKQLFENDRFSVSFTYNTPKELKDLLSQTWNTEKIDVKHKMAILSTGSNDVIDLMRANPNFEHVCSQTIVTTGNDGGIVLKSVLATAINRYYNANDFKLNSQKQECSNWIVEFYNYFTELYIDEMLNINKTKLSSWLLGYTNPIWVVYLSKLVKEKLTANPQYDWKIAIKKTFDSVDFSKNNPLFIEVIKPNYQVTERKMLLIEDYFRKAFNNV